MQACRQCNREALRFLTVQSVAEGAPAEEAQEEDVWLCPLHEEQARRLGAWARAGRSYSVVVGVPPKHTAKRPKVSGPPSPEAMAAYKALFPGSRPDPRK
ncbi:MAG: hypothetical protein EXR66_01770 [Dehalococcoidia bacterium]|nr:hypothetical protein [Dehalococcoidia bacterium]